MSKNYSESSRVISWILLIILSVIWGSSFILIKKSLDYFTPLEVGALRIIFAFMVLLPFALTRAKNITRNKWKIFAFTGLVSNLIPAILFAIAQTKIDSSLTGILNALTPLFTVVIAVYYFKFRINLKQITGIIIGLAGTVLLSFINNSGSVGNLNVYIWLIVLATICYALNLNVIKYYLSGEDSLTITSLAIFISGPVSLIILPFTVFFEKINFSAEFLIALLYVALLGIFGTAIALILYTKLIKISTTLFASSVTYLIPIVAVAWGFLDDELLFPLHFAGMVLILLGIYFINKSDSKDT